MGICCGKAKPNEHGKAQKSQMMAAPMAVEKKSSKMTPEQQMAVMKEFVSVGDRKAEQIMKTNKDQVMNYLMTPSNLLKEIREGTRFEATPLLVKAFEAFDDQPHDGKLSVVESKNFISAYFRCIESFIEHVYRVGLELVEPEGNAKHTDVINRVLALFKTRSEELTKMWHTSCDKNGDGELQLQEVKEAFLGNGAGDAERQLGNFLENELNTFLFSDEAV